MRSPLLAAALVAAACASTPEAPPVTVNKAEVQRLDTSQQTFLDFSPTALVKLGAPAAVEVREATWEVVHAGKVLKSGSAAVNRSVAPGEGLEVSAAGVPYIEPERFGEILEVEGALEIVMRGRVVDTAGNVYEYTRAGRVRTPRVPKVKVWHIEGVTYSDEQRIKLIFFLRVQNDNPFDLELKRIDYELSVNGAPVDKGVTGKDDVVFASTAAQLEVEVNLTKENFPQVLDAIRGRLPLSYGLEGEVALAVGRVPVELEGAVELGAPPPEE